MATALKSYFCDCPVYCKSRKLVGKTTYYKHAKFRHQLTTDFVDTLLRFDERLGGATISAAATPSSLSHEPGNIGGTAGPLFSFEPQERHLPEDAEITVESRSDVDIDIVRLHSSRIPSACH